ncbi:hypothetical protein V6x_54300 [Gimesia chilikensis]|uniref:Transmembrane protein n=1 Tax=Gimesia chilikensis TaxID=2605989 RepID=A0A517WKE0_9PLAN|nr:hypothetical protein [Gimesia chilikensis]QDU05689.1 hypothetical protein V6x_54300 [Gimesia chilikensis]
MQNEVNENLKPSGALQGFMIFVSDFKILLFYIIGLGGSPWLIEYIFNIGPPWPNTAAVSAFTSIVIWLTLLWSFASWEKVLQVELTILVKRFCIVTFCLLCIYAVVVTWFVVPADDFQNREAIGFILRPEIVEELEKDKSKTIKILFEGAEYEPTEIWKPWTVNCIRSLIILIWFFWFGSLSFVISTFILHQYRGELIRLKNQEEKVDEIKNGSNISSNIPHE